MSAPDDRRYSESHEWFKLEGDTVTVGITRFAVDQLTDVTFAEMKGPGTTVDSGEAIGEIESVKTTSAVCPSVPGEIVEVNDELESNPAVINEDPYEKGWLVKIKAGDTSPLDNLMDSKTYTDEHAA